MKQDSPPGTMPSLGKVLREYFSTIPKWIFMTVYLLYTFPRRLRYHRRYAQAAKCVQFRLLAPRRMKVDEATTLIYELRQKEQPHLLLKKLTWYGRLDDLMEEERSPLWKIPTVTELERVREELCLHIRTTSFGYYPEREISLWAIDDSLKMFAGYCPFTGKSTLANPEDVIKSCIQAKPPNSREDHFAYAVSVTVKEEDA